MAKVNLYTQPAQADFVNSYIPIPFDELNRAAATRQNAHDQNLARADQTQSMLDQLKYIPNSKDQEYVESARRKISDLIDSNIGKDWSDQEVYRQLRSDFRSTINMDEIDRIQRSAAGYENYQKSSAQMKARGENIYKPQDFSGYNTLDPSQGIFSAYPTMDLGAQADKAINEFLDKPQIQSREATLPSGRIAIEQYRDINMINDLINNDKEVSVLMNDPSIQQFMDKEGLDGEGFREYLKGRAPDYTRSVYGSVGYPPGYGKETDPKDPNPGDFALETSWDMSPSGFGNGRDGYRGRKIIENNTKLSEDVMPTLKVGKNSINLNGGKSRTEMLTDVSRRQQRKEITAEQASIEKRKIFDDYDAAKVERKSAGKQIQFDNTKEGQKDKETFTNYLAAAGKYYNMPDIANMNPEDQLETIDNYLIQKQQNGVGAEVVNYANEGREANAKALSTQNQIVSEFGALTNRAVYDIDNGVDQQLMSTSELMDLYPPDDQITGDTKGYTWNIIGETADVPRQELANAKQVEIRDPEGKAVKRVFIGGSKGEVLKGNARNSMVRHMLFGENDNDPKNRNWLPKGEFKIPGEFGEYTIEWEAEETEQTPTLYTIFVKYPTNEGEIAPGIGPITGYSISELIQKIAKFTAMDLSDEE